MTEYVVVCRDDAQYGKHGPFVRACRQIFKSKYSASRYAGTISQSREPHIVPLSEYLVDYEGWRFAA